jgi:hypothetical protein
MSLLLILSLPGSFRAHTALTAERRRVTGESLRQWRLPSEPESLRLTIARHFVHPLVLINHHHMKVAVALHRRSYFCPAESEVELYGIKTGMIFLVTLYKQYCQPEFYAMWRIIRKATFTRTASIARSPAKLRTKIVPLHRQRSPSMMRL